jgi:hypothetical protein
MEMTTCPKCNYRFDKDQNPPFSPVTTSTASPALTAQEIAKASYEHRIKVGKPMLEKPEKGYVYHPGAPDGAAGGNTMTVFGVVGLTLGVVFALVVLRCLCSDPSEI